MNLNMEYRKGILFIRTDKLFNKYLDSNINLLVNQFGIRIFVLNIYKLKQIDINCINLIYDWNNLISKNNGKLYICENNKSIFVNLFKNKIPIIDNELEIFN